MRADHSGGVLPGRKRTQAGHRIIAVGGAHRGEQRLMGPVVVESVCHVGKRHLGPGAGHPVGQHRGHPRQAFGTAPTDHQRGDRRGGLRQTRGGLRRPAQDQMRVGAAEAER